MDNRILFPSVLVLYTFAAYVFCLLLYLQLRQYRLRHASWGGWAWRLLTALFAAVYCAYLAGHVSIIATDGLVGEMPAACRLMVMAAMPFVGPLLIQLFYNVERERLDHRWFWKVLIVIEYTAAMSSALAAPFSETPSLPAWTDRFIDHAQTVSDAALAAAGLACAGISWCSRNTADSPSRTRQRRWYVALVCALESGFVVQAHWGTNWFTAAFRLLPLLFTLVTVYYGERLAFWDVFVKRGLFFFLALITLAAQIAVLGPLLDLALLNYARSWIVALSIVPLVAAAPWASARLNAWVDRAWLGRRYSPVDAVRGFTEALQSATSEADLLDRAELSLGDIFNSEARILRDVTLAPGGGLIEPLDAGGECWGSIHILARPGEVSFLSQDSELLVVLARALGAAIESETLRAQKLEQQRRERELALAAAQSELKALRAQINPHFLFNALNTIAALIPSKPALAEQTVEQLSEVFRYTVRHSEREWVRLEDEIAFVSAYLDIERARFGERLSVRFDIAPAARDVRIPAMVVQTLVENAVKHGVSAVRGPGSIAIAASTDGGALRVSVEDSGPGFASDVRPEALPEPSRGGYGLRNVRERLRAYYGGEAQLAFGLSPAGLTEVSIRVPLTAEVLVCER